MDNKKCLSNTVELAESVGKINERRWGSKKRDVKENQHTKNKKWYIHDGLKRTKLRWNKKKGVQELSKKGSRDRICWSD